MHTAQHHMDAAQNLGWIDRTVRIVIGFALLSVLYIGLSSGQALGWNALIPILSIYPFMTGILGWDPLYAAVHLKSCDTSNRNQCGTFPFEIGSALGKHLKCNNGYDCSIEGNEKEEHK